VAVMGEVQIFLACCFSNDLAVLRDAVAGVQCD